MLDHLPGGQVLVDVLADVEGRHRVERQPGDDAERAEGHHSPGEPARVGLPAHGHEVAVRGDHLDGRHRRGEAADGVAGAVGPGRARAGHRDVRQRRQVGQRAPGLLQRDGRLAVRQARAQPDGRSGGVDLDQARQARHGNEIAGSVRQAVERMAGSEGPDPRAPGHQALQLRQGCRPVEALGSERDITRPVHRLSGHLGEAYRRARGRGRLSCRRARPPAPGPGAGWFPAPRPRRTGGRSRLAGARPPT